MNVFVILAHHEPKSFNGALFDTAVTTLKNAGHTVTTSDLHRMQFNPAMRPAAHHAGGLRSA